MHLRVFPFACLTSNRVYATVSVLRIYIYRGMCIAACSIYTPTLYTSEWVGESEPIRHCDSRE